MHQPGEPSVEVILDSIKRVIARENRTSNARGNRSGAVEFAHPADETRDIEPADADEAAEVLQLDEDEIVAHAPLRLEEEADGAIPAPEHGGGDDDDLAAYDWAEPEGLGAADAAAYQEAVTDDDTIADHSGESRNEPASEEPLTSEQTRVAMRENLAALSMLTALSRERREQGAGEVSIEALTRDLLRPMLADWLDANLPPIVERLVQAEVKRIVGEQG